MSIRFYFGGDSHALYVERDVKHFTCLIKGDLLIFYEDGRVKRLQKRVDFDYYSVWSK